MNIYISQIYVEAGIDYPFSHHFQMWLSQELSKRAHPSPDYLERFPKDFKIIFRMSAKSKIIAPEIRGPAIFKRTKDIEFTIFLPHGGSKPENPDGFRLQLKLLLDSIVTVLQSIGIDASQVEQDAPALIEHILRTPEMIIRRGPSIAGK